MGLRLGLRLGLGVGVSGRVGTAPVAAASAEAACALVSSWLYRAATAPSVRDRHSRRR